MSFKYVKRPQEDYENIYISNVEQCGFQYFVAPLQKERKEVSEKTKDGTVSFHKLKNSLNKKLMVGPIY